MYELMTKRSFCTPKALDQSFLSILVNLFEKLINIFNNIFFTVSHFLKKKTTTKFYT